MPATCAIDSANAAAFLKLIRYAEHYPDESDDFYHSLYGGGRFDSLATHPKITVTRWGHSSNAAGAYQVLYSTWAEARSNGVVSDFSEASQDKLAFEKIRTRQALEAVCSGEVELACMRLSKEWTSLPTGKQTRMAMAVAKAAFARFGGTAS